MITGRQLRDALISAANNITNNKDSVDALNIFPVPDGDTGTNMSKTMNSAVNVLKELSDDVPVSVVAEKAASAFLRGARGNSGAITSLIFRGFAEGLRGCESANGVVIATALKLAAEHAYKSVMAPTEGTILTVIRLAGDAAKESAGVDVPAVKVFEDATEGARKALKRTPELLSILKRAKVVDAGGQGLVYILEAMLSVFRDDIIIEAKEHDSETDVVVRDVQSGEDIRFAYCTELLIEKKNATKMDVILLKSRLYDMGDSVVVVDDEDVIKVHIHTNEPGEVISHAIKYGNLENVKVENMRLQHKHTSWGSKADSIGPEDVPVVEATKRFGFVSVGAGEGIAAAMKELGVDMVVSGGQTMNPSTDDILNAVNQTPAEIVYILPNNKNIILTAMQAASLTEKKVLVVQTRSIPEGIAALIAFDPDVNETDNYKMMNNAIKDINTVNVTFAARDSSVGGMDIKEGDIMGLENGKVTVVDSDPNNVAYRCVKRMIKRNTSFITIYYGEGMTEEAAYRLCDTISAKYGNDIEIAVVYGGQPVYYYIISLE
jgi:DAK2 domain fusion protein YloV